MSDKPSDKPTDSSDNVKKIIELTENLKNYFEVIGNS